MSAREMQLMSRIIRTGQLTPVLEWGITPEDYLTSEGRAMFNSVLGYYSRSDTAGSVIGANAVQQFFPNFVLCDDPSMTTEALCNEVRETRRRLDLKAHLQRAMDISDRDPGLAAAEIQRGALDILNLGGKNRDLRLTTAFDKVLTKYQMKKQGIDLSCAQWPWEPLNAATGGIEAADYVVFYGRPKSMKSWVLAYLIAWIFNSGKRALIYTKEMTGENIFARVIACIAEIRYQELRMGGLAPYEEYQLYAAHRMVNAMRRSEQLIALEGSEEEGTDTVPWLRSKVDSYKPDFVFIDGIYLMSDVQRAKKDHERVRNISRGLRQLALKTRIPVIATLQANRAAAANQDANLDEIAFTDAIGQDATHIFRCINEKGSPTIALVVGGAREFKLNGFRIHAEVARDFSYFGPLSSQEITKAKEQDKGDEDDASAHVAQSNGKKPKMNTEAQAVATVSSRINQMI
jgi:hypothetical protein